MTEWLVGGGLGVAVTGMIFGYLLWRERGKRADAQHKADVLESALRDSTGKLVQSQEALASVRKRLAEREVDVRDLEQKLAAVDPGQLLDDVFDGGV